MRTHYQIIKDAGNEKIAEALGGIVPVNTVRSWRQRSSIPSEHWVPLAAANFATLEEFAAAVRPRRRGGEEC